jgi:hypothetical protein
MNLIELKPGYDGSERPYRAMFLHAAVE